MKIILAFTLAIVVMVCTARVLAPMPCPQRATFVQRVLSFIAGWWITNRLFRDEAPPEPLKDMPSQYVPGGEEKLAIEGPNAIQGQAIAQQPMRTISADGTPQLNHAAGW